MQPLFEFGAGLSYTTFTHTCAAAGNATEETYSFACDVTNTGTREGDQVSREKACVRACVRVV
jgi:hypothetical protein